MLVEFFYPGFLSVRQLKLADLLRRSSLLCREFNRRITVLSLIAHDGLPLVGILRIVYSEQYYCVAQHLLS